METLYNIYHIDKSSKRHKDYFIVFGNASHGWNCDKNELKEYWKKAVKCSANSRYYGDVSLFYKNKIIRAVNNFNIRLLDKKAKYKCQYKKYNI